MLTKTFWFLLDLHINFHFQDQSCYDAVETIKAEFNDSLQRPCPKSEITCKKSYQVLIVFVSIVSTLGGQACLFFVCFLSKSLKKKKQHRHRRYSPRPLLEVKMTKPRTGWNPAQARELTLCTLIWYVYNVSSWIIFLFIVVYVVFDIFLNLFLILFFQINIYIKKNTLAWLDIQRSGWGENFKLKYACDLNTFFAGLIFFLFYFKPVKSYLVRRITKCCSLCQITL